MQSQEEISKINYFLSAILPIVVRSVKTVLQSTGLEVEEKGRGLDIAFHIKSGKREADFLLHNLLLEIATIDRDETPLRFDERLNDFDYFLAKTARLTQSKLNILGHFLSEENPESAIEKIKKVANRYERIRIWRLDQKESS